MRNVLLVGSGSRIARSRDARQLRLGILRPRQKAAVPDVVRLERPTEPLLDERGHARHERRRNDALEQLLDARFGNLPVELEPPVDLGRREWRVLVRATRRAEVGEDHRVSRVLFPIARRHCLDGALSLRFHLFRLDLLGGSGGDAARVDEPVEPRVVDHRTRDRLCDDLLHDCCNEPLPREPERRVRFGVLGLDLIAQVPVADEPHAFGKQAPPVARQHMVHP